MVRKIRRSNKRYFVLVTKGKRGIYTGSQPRRAALKVATMGINEIRLRERGTDKVHVYAGARKKVSAPEDKPAWLPATVWRPSVHKKGIERIAKKTKAIKIKSKKKNRRQ